MPGGGGPVGVPPEVACGIIAVSSYGEGAGRPGALGGAGGAGGGPAAGVGGMRAVSS
ncbi:hypothetical protein EES44_02335 [Streptomyces sp. ADI96-15]|nr:hypothetical protein EES44_02335 [Streptomyces sp. ADI96-15]